MRFKSGWILSLLVMCASGAGATAPPPALSTVVAQLNAAAARIHSVEASAISQYYTAIVSDLETQSGTMYFRKTHGGHPEFALHLKKPAPHIVIYKHTKVWNYQPAIQQVQIYDLRKHQTAQQYLTLGLGGTGTDLEKLFRLRVVGTPRLDGRPTVELELTPIAAAVARNFTRIDIWYDSRTWIAVQQQFWQPGGNYRLLQYRQPQINVHIPGSAFSTHFHGAKVLRPRT